MARVLSDKRIWRTLTVTAVLAFVLPLLLSLLPAFDLWQIAYFALVVPLSILVWSIVALMGRRRKLWVSLIVFAAVTALCLKADYFFRVHGRWLYLASSSKKRLIAQGTPTDGQLPHLDWDGWGVFAQDTEVYLVNDPVNATIAIRRSAGGLHAKGVPCTFWRAYHLEPHWYALVFFTNTSWESCTY